jgi:glycosyltransferase involved in cell wall biosynthesis
MFSRNKSIAVAVDTNVDTGMFFMGMNVVKALKLAGLNVKVLDLYKPVKVDNVIVVSTIHHVTPWINKARRVFAYIPIEGFVKLSYRDYVDAVRNAYSVATTSDYAKQFLKDIRSDVHVVPLGIDYDYFSNCGNYDREFDVGIVLSASHIGAEELGIRKGIDLYDDVLKSSSYSFIGNKYVMHYLSNWKRMSLIVDSPRQVYCNSRVFLWLSRSEGFGLPPLEAMAAGTPVIYTDAPAHNQHTCCFKIPIVKTWIYDRHDMAYTFLMHEPNKYAITTAIDVALQYADEYRDTVRELAKQHDMKSFSYDLMNWILNARK